MKSDKDYSECQTSFEDDLDQIQHEYDLLLLKELSVEHAKKQADAFSKWTEEEKQIPDHDFSSLDLQFSALLQEQKKQQNRLHAARRIKNFGKRAAALAIVAMASFTVLFFSVDAVKLNVVNLIVRSYERSTQFHMEDMFGKMPQEIPPLTEADFRAPSYLPYGFEEAAYNFISGQGNIVYESPDSPYILSYSCMEFSTSVLLDTEDCMSESVSVNGYDALLYTKYRGDLKGHTSLIWHDERYIYLISGPVCKKEIVKMAESLY